MDLSSTLVHLRCTLLQQMSVAQTMMSSGWIPTLPPSMYTA